MPPVQPRPTTTTSTSFKRVAMRLAQIRDAEDFGGVFFVAILLDVLAMHRDDAGESDHLPARFVAVAAVDRVGEHALHHGLVEDAPEVAHRQGVLEGDLVGGERDKNLLALLLAHSIERLAI